MISAPTAIIFDLDGTLLDTETIATQSIENVLKRRFADFESDSNPFVVPWELKKALLGLRGDVWPDMVLKYFGLIDKMEGKELLQEWEIELKVMNDKIQMMDNAKEIVEKSIKLGLKIAIATSSNYHSYLNKTKNFQETFAQFHHVVCGDDPELLNGKPAPDIYLLAAKRLEVEPNLCLVFEDALPGVIAGISAGMQVCACPDKRCDAVDLEAFHQWTPHLISSLKEYDWTEWGYDQPKDKE